MTGSREPDVSIGAAREADELVVRRILDAGLLRYGRLEARIDAACVLVARVDPEEPGEGAEPPPAGSIVGALVAVPRDGRTEIEAIAVRRRRRGRGIGSALVEAAAARWGPLVASFEPELTPFYESLGFVVEREEPGSDRRRGRLG